RNQRGSADSFCPDECPQESGGVWEQVARSEGSNRADVREACGCRRLPSKIESAIQRLTTARGHEFSGSVYGKGAIAEERQAGSLHADPWGTSCVSFGP